MFDKIARLHAVMLAEAALANESAAREQNGASVFSDIERRLLRRLVQADEESAPPSWDEFNQLFQLFERAAERPYVPFPGMPRLKQMLALIEAANAEANDDAPLPAELGMARRGRADAWGRHLLRSVSRRPVRRAARCGVPSDAGPSSVA